MTTGEKTCFPGEVAVHLDIEYHVASNILVSGKDPTTPYLFHCVIAFLNINLHISLLLLNGEFPKVSPRSLITPQGLFDCLGNSESKLVGFPPIYCLDLVNDSISPTQYIFNPPPEIRFFL